MSSILVSESISEVVKTLQPYVDTKLEYKPDNVEVEIRDYDTDGVTSSAILYKTLKILGANVDVFIPHREEDGYGINIENVKQFVESDYHLLVTVDCGIGAISSGQLTSQLGVELIITDHHQPGEQLPKPFA